MPPIPRSSVSCWSLSKLCDSLIETGRVATTSLETVRRILHERGITFQTTKTWKASIDPDFTTKMRRVLDLYDHPPADGRVICVDELGPRRREQRVAGRGEPHGAGSRGRKFGADDPFQGAIEDGNPDWTIGSRSAALVKPASSARATTCRSWRSSAR